MANDNGGIIGIINTPTADTASGVWSIDSQYQAQTTGAWPPIPSLGVNSARFNKASGDYLNRTQGTPTSRRTFTYSGWIKISELNIYNILFESATGSHSFQMVIQNNGNGNDFRVYDYDGSTNLNLRTSQAFRDVSAWYHIVLAVDTTQGTASNRAKLYVNGEQVTSFSTATYPSQNYDTAFANGVNMQIGRQQSASDYFSGYMSEINFVDGQQLAPTSFGAFNTNGVWTPIIPAVTYGTNGFRLKFGNSANLGEDSSPNGNNFTVNNLTSVDQSGDYPVNNFATLNPLLNSITAFENGNTSLGSTSDNTMAISTFGASQGGYYAEMKLGNSPNGSTGYAIRIGIVNLTTSNLSFGGMGGYAENASPYYGVQNVSGGSTNYFKMYNNGTVPASADTGVSSTAGDIIMIAWKNDKLYMGKNGTWFNSGNPASETNPLWTLPSGGTWGVGVMSSLGGASDSEFNFGHPPYAISSGNADANGYGNFEYTVPSGYYSLCTKNLAEFG